MANQCALAPVTQSREIKHRRGKEKWEKMRACNFNLNLRWEKVGGWIVTGPRTNRISKSSRFKRRMRSMNYIITYVEILREINLIFHAGRAINSKKKTVWELLHRLLWYNTDFWPRLSHLNRKKCICYLKHFQIQDGWRSEDVNLRQNAKPKNPSIALDHVNLYFVTRTWHDTNSMSRFVVSGGKNI